MFAVAQSVLNMFQMSSEEAFHEKEQSCFNLGLIMFFVGEKKKKASKHTVDLGHLGCSQLKLNDKLRHHKGNNYDVI